MSRRRTVNVDELAVGDVTTAGTIVSIERDDDGAHYTVTFDTGGALRLNHLQALVVKTP